MHDILDLTEGDKLAVVVVELHVGPRRSGNKIRYLCVYSSLPLCNIPSLLLNAVRRCQRVCGGGCLLHLWLSVIAATHPSLVGPRRQCDALGKQDQVFVCVLFPPSL